MDLTPVIPGDQTYRQKQSEARKEDISPGIIARILNGVNGFMDGIRGKNPKEADWFGPEKPLTPVAPESVKGRAIDYPVGYNLNTTPRAYEPISFAQLRALADGYDILRLAIETRKDQMEKLKWSILPKVNKSVSNSRDKPNDRCFEIEKFFNNPDKENNWNGWLRILLEDLFVIDAPVLYARKSLGDKVYAFEIVDGSTIKRVITADGRTPDAPNPAYQQILKGLPAVDYTIDEIVYMPRNKRPHKFYGYSPVEQIIMTVNIAIRRQIHKLQFYTEGNIPEALIGVPETWTVDQIGQFQLYWDSLMEGNTAARRHAKFIPGNMNVNYTRDPALQDQYDEWLARVICYAFSLPPLPFVKEQNRATAISANEAAIEEGLAPLMEWVKRLIDFLIVKYWGYTDIEFVWDDIKEQDQATKASINIQYFRAGVMSLDELRAEIGREPLGIGHIAWGVGPMGFMFLDDIKKAHESGATLMGPQALAPAAPGLPPGAPPGSLPSSQGPLSGVPAEVLAAAGLPPDVALTPGSVDLAGKTVDPKVAQTLLAVTNSIKKGDFAEYLQKDYP